VTQDLSEHPRRPSTEHARVSGISQRPIAACRAPWGRHHSAHYDAMQKTPLRP